jgi:uncharacterized membrane protein (UPF0127 family)
VTSPADEPAPPDGDADDAGGHRPSARRWIVRGVWLVVVVALGVLFVQGANRPEDPYLLPRERDLIAGFAESSFRITSPGGDAAEWCAMLADRDETRAQGLMEQDDLRGYDGMIFAFDEPTFAGFWMRDTRIPLSIAFFDEDGGFVGARDMEPCPDDEENCPTYGPDEAYRYAIEVPQGELDGLGIGPEARLELAGDGCGGSEA